MERRAFIVTLVRDGRAARSDFRGSTTPEVQLPQSQVLDPAVTFRETANGELVFGEPRALSQCAMDQHHAAGGHTIPPDTGAATSVFMSTRAAGTFLLLRKASRPIFFALLAAVISVMATPTAAHAAFGVQSFHAETRQSDNVTLFTQAGGHPSFGVTSFTINTTAGGLPDGGLLDGGGVLKNIHVDVPPGVIPNPQSLPKCTSPTPILATCGVATQIGTTTILVLANVAPPITAPITVPVFNMEPALGQVSDFAFSLGVAAPRVNIEGGVRDTSDYGPTFDIRNLSGNPPVMGATLSFWGVPGEHTTGGSPAPFLTNPTFCGPPYTTGLTLQSQTGVTATDSDTTPTGATGCDRVPFNPTISVTPGTTRRDSPMGGSVNLHVPAVLDPTHIESSQVKTTALTLPEGLTLNPSGASGLQACTDAQLAKGTHDPVTCPDASKVGIAEIRSATLAAPLTGSLWSGQPVSPLPAGDRTVRAGRATQGLRCGRPGHRAAHGDVRGHPADAVHRLHAHAQRRAACRARDTAELRRSSDDQLDHALQRERPHHADRVLHG